MKELYYEDVTILILNQLYNNNIPVQMDENNQYIVYCKYKNLNNVFSLITAILNDVFYQMFHQTFEVTIQCEIKE